MVKWDYYTITNNELTPPPPETNTTIHPPLSIHHYPSTTPSTTIKTTIVHFLSPILQLRIGKVYTLTNFFTGGNNR